MTVYISSVKVVGVLPQPCILFPGLSMLEGKSREQIYDDWKYKVLPTYLIGTALWIPAQVLNFKVVPPQFRVAYVASFVLLEVNVLCFVRKFSPENVTNKMTSFLNETDSEKFESCQSNNIASKGKSQESKSCPEEDETKTIKNKRNKQ